MKKESLIKMGFATQPHGLKGEVELRLLNAEDSVLDDEQRVWLFPSGEKSMLSPKGEEWVIKKLRFGNKVICLFEGIVDRTDLEKYLPFELYLDRSDFPETDDGEVYLVDLVDMPVFNESDEKIGVLESFSDNGMQYLFDVRLNDGSRITLPFVDAFFPKIDVENKKITMIMPDYTE